jgi:DNA primase
VVSPDKNLWHCLGACQMGGSVVDWVMKSRGVSFRHAVELIKEEHPALAADPTAERRGGRQKGAVPAHSTKRPLSDGAAFVREAADETLLSQVVDFYLSSAASASASSSAAIAPRIVRVAASASSRSRAHAARIAAQWP